MHAFPLPGLSQILCENNTYIHFVLLCLADAFLFYIPSFVRSDVCSFFILQPTFYPLHPPLQISKQLPRQTWYQLHKLTFLESKGGTGGEGRNWDFFYLQQKMAAVEQIWSMTVRE